MPVAATTMNLPGQGPCNVDSHCTSPSSMLRESLSTSTLPPVPPPLPVFGQPPPPPPLGGLRAPVRPDSAPPSSRVSPRYPEESSIVQLPQQRTPFPRLQMKRFQWSKIPIGRVTSNPENLWTEVAGMFGGYQLNFERMEELFASGGNATSSISSVSGCAGAKVRELPVSERSTCERKTKKIDEINLLDSKRSMNVNIFLRQFRMSNVDIVNSLRSGDSQKIGPERLRSLLKILPEPEDVQLLSAFDGDRCQLGSAEKFYLELIALPNHKFLAEALLTKEEFSQTIDCIKPAIDAIILSARDLKDSKALHQVLYTVLIAGNFLNSGVYSGNAAGFQLQSLLKLSELRANKPRMNLLHFVAQETEAKNPQLIDKLKELKYLAEASQYSVESLLSDISTLQNRIRTISSQISIADSQFQQQMKDFLEMAHSEIEVLELDVRELEELRLELAAYFCEDVQSFKLDDCISNFNTFCKMFHKALEENKERHLQDLRAEERRRLREQQIAKKRRSVDDTQTRRSPDGDAMTSPEASLRSTDVVDNARPWSNNSSERRIQISQTMPSFLMEPTQDSSREVSPCPGTVPTHRLKKRNSVSNFMKLDNRKLLPQTPGESITTDERENELIDVLLKTASAAEETDRRPGSSTRQRRRSRVSIDILDRERAPSPSPLSSSVSHMDAASPTHSTPNGEQHQLDRGQPGRSSCPSRISSAQGRKQLLRDALLHQQAAQDTTAPDSQVEEPGSCPSDAEMSAKQERENRRLERRRRSHIESISCGDGNTAGNTPTSDSGIGEPRPTTGLDLNPQRTNSAAESEHLHLPFKQSAETQSGEVDLRSGKSHNLTNGSNTSSADLLYEDAKSRSTVPRRNAANIRSLADQRRWSDLENGDRMTQLSNSSEIGQAMTTVATTDDTCIMAKGASEHNISQTVDGKTVRKATVGQDPVPTVPPQKSRLNNHQRNIPEQRISGVAKLGSSSHKNTANTEALRKNEIESREVGLTQSDSRLVRDFNENLTEPTHSPNQKLTTGEGASSQSQGPSADEDYKKRWGKVFENKKTEVAHVSSSSHRPSLENEKVNEITEMTSNAKEPATPIQSATVRDYSETFSSATTVERASFRKEKLRKLSQLYSSEDDDGGYLKKHRSANNHRSEVALQHATASDQDQPPNRTPSRESTDPKSDTDSTYSARDDGFESEGHSLCSASQRTSMSSTAESDIRITPMMTRKVYPSAGEKEAGDEHADRPYDSETSTVLGRSSTDSAGSERIERMYGSVKHIDDKPRGMNGSVKHVDDTRRASSPLTKSLTRTSSKSLLSVSRDRQATDKTGVRKSLAKPTESQRPKTQPYGSATAARSKVLPKTVQAPKSGAVSNTVQYRIAKPNLVSVSRTPTGKSDSRGAKTNPDKTPMSSPATKQRAISATMSKSPSKIEPKPKATGSIKKQSTENRVTSIAGLTPNPSTIGEKVPTPERTVHPQAFIRGVGVRATVPADVLRENKKAALESRQVRNIATPVPPRRTTSLIDANNAAPIRTTAVPVLHPKKPPVSSTGLPPVQLPISSLNTTLTANDAIPGTTRKTASELRKPIVKADRSKVPARTPDHAARKPSTYPQAGDCRVHSSASTASVGLTKRKQDSTPVPSVQTKLINVKPLSATSSAVNDKGKTQTPATKAVSVSNLA